MLFYGIKEQEFNFSYKNLKSNQITKYNSNKYKLNLIKMNKAQLVKAADELNKLLFDDPEIDVKSGPKEMKATIYEALTCLRTGDTVSKETVAVLLECDFPFDATFFEQIEKEDQDDVLSVLQTLGIWVNKEDDENPAEGAEEAEEAEDIVEDTKEYSLEEEIDDAQSMKVLKDIVKVYDELKELRGILTKYKTKKALKAAMVAILTEAESAEIEEKEKPEKEKPKAAKEEMKVEKPKASEEEKKEETPKADKKDAPKTEKSVKQKVPGTPSNKEVVYLLWKAGEEKLEILYKAVEVNVKEKTVKSWVNQWKKGSNLPACAKK